MTCETPDNHSARRRPFPRSPYNEGYGGRGDLAAEAIRLGRALAEPMPDEPSHYLHATRAELLRRLDRVEAAGRATAALELTRAPSALSRTAAGALLRG